MAQQNQDDRQSGSRIMLLDHDLFKDELRAEQSSLEKVLAGTGTQAERFQTITWNAVVRNPELLDVAHHTLLIAVRQAAQDGLMPDGREGAIVVRWDKNLFGKGRGGKAAHWMPMVQGLVAKAKRRGSVRSLICELVFEGEPFEVELGDSIGIKHTRKVELMDESRIRACYAIAELADGTREREVMSIAQIEKVRALSSGADFGPWKNSYGEMVRKTVIRRLSKRLPTLEDGDEDLGRAIDRVDELYDFGRRRAAAGAAQRGPTIEGEASEAKAAEEKPKRQAKPPEEPKPESKRPAQEKPPAQPQGPSDEGNPNDPAVLASLSLGELNERMPVRYIDAKGLPNPSDTLDSWRGNWLARVKTASGDHKMIPKLGDGYQRNMEAIASVRAMSPEHADEVEKAIRVALGLDKPEAKAAGSHAPTTDTTDYPTIPDGVDTAKKLLEWLGLELDRMFPADRPGFVAHLKPQLDMIRNAPGRGGETQRTVLRAILQKHLPDEGQHQ